MTITASTHRKLSPLSESEAIEMQLDSYVMHRGRQHCSNCDCLESYSTIFEVWIHPTKTPRTGLTSLRLHASPTLKNLPMSHLTLPVREIPVCDDCVEWYEGIVSFSKTIGHASREAWADTLRRKYAPAPATTTSQPSTKEPSLDTL